MFSLDLWVSKIDLSDVLCMSIEDMDQAKDRYSVVNLNQICMRHIDKSFHNFYQVYTDGSKSHNNAGAAFYDPQMDIRAKFKIEASISIMHVELLAIVEALSYISSTLIDKIVILTDSKSALQHLARCSSTFRGLPIAYEIIKIILNIVAQNKIIKIQWIPSHINIPGNEMADQLADIATYEGDLLRVCPFYTDCINLLQDKCARLWKEYFDQRSRDKGIWYRTIQSEPFTSWVSNCSLNRQDSVHLMRLRSGHIPLNKFGFLMKKVPSPDCPDCDRPEDVHHILLECVRNEAKRWEIFNRFPLLRQTGGCNGALTQPLSDEARALLHLYKKSLRQ